MKILVACEESQAVTIELRRIGHEAYSCDIEPCSGGHPEWHLQVDALELLKMKWDMILAFPPCTHLAVSGARYFEQKRKDGRQQAAIDFFMQFENADCSKIAIEIRLESCQRFGKTRPDYSAMAIWSWRNKENVPLAERLAAAHIDRNC